MWVMKLKPLKIHAHFYFLLGSRLKVVTDFHRFREIGPLGGTSGVLV